MMPEELAAAKTKVIVIHYAAVFIIIAFNGGYNVLSGITAK